jgi:hypothetical protein
MKKEFKLENLGLGKGPYKLIDYFEIQAPDTDSGALFAIPIKNRTKYPVKNIGVCAICGTPIKNNYVVRSSDNEIFVVGCECIKKINDCILIDAVKRHQKILNKVKDFHQAKALFSNFFDSLTQPQIDHLKKEIKTNYRHFSNVRQADEFCNIYEALKDQKERIEKIQLKKLSDILQVSFQTHKQVKEEIAYIENLFT